MLLRVLQLGDRDDVERRVVNRQGRHSARCRRPGQLQHQATAAAVYATSDSSAAAVLLRHPAGRRQTVPTGHQRHLLGARTPRLVLGRFERFCLGLPPLHRGSKCRIPAIDRPIGQYQ